MSDEGLQILVVDDEAHIRTGLATGLSGEGTLVDTAKNGVEALEKFRRGKHQIVITDVRLPGDCDGLDVLREIRDTRPETLVIVITAYGTIETAVEAMRDGAYDLFLDEITETSRKSQVDLLRVLEQREFRRLGGEQVIPADVRLLSATNRDIRELVRQGESREDLYYRLNVIPVQIPPLRERRDDIPLLVDHFVQHFCRRHGRDCKRFANKAIQVLVGHGWPGNIRQLRNLIERLVVTVDGEVIYEEDLPGEVRTESHRSGRTLQAAAEQAEKTAILAALAECDNHRERTAKLLDISLRTLHYKMRRYDLH